MSDSLNGKPYPSLTTNTTVSAHGFTSGGEIMTVEETAGDATRASVSYWRKKIAANALPVVRLGSRTILRRSDVDAFLAAHLSAPTSELTTRAEAMVTNSMLRTRRTRKAVQS